MSSRFPTSQLSDQVAVAGVEEEIRSLVGGGEPPFSYKNSKGDLIGCYALLAYSDSSLVTPWFAYARAAYAPERISARFSELAVLATLSIHIDPYLVESHLPIASAFGISRSQFGDAIAGRVPQDIPAEECAVYKLARRLAQGKSQLSDEEWTDVSNALGKTVVLAIAHVVGGFLSITTLGSVAGRLNDVDGEEKQVDKMENEHEA